MKQLIYSLVLIILVVFTTALGLARYTSIRVYEILGKEQIVRHMNALEDRIIKIESGDNYTWQYK